MCKIMSELPPQSIEKPRSELPIEQQANYEGSWTNLMCERLRNPEIRKQVIDLLVEQDQATIDEAKKAVEKRKKQGEAFKKTFSDILTDINAEKKSTSRKQFEEQFEETFQKIIKNTPTSFSKKMPNSGGGPEGREILNLRWSIPKTGKRPTRRQWDILKSHEKGHKLRLYNAFYTGEKFWKAFDFSFVELTEQDCEDYRKHGETDDAKLKTNDEIKNIVVDYLKFPMEIAERMSQLKNYFGLTGTDKFTKEHLAYAREHYIKDTEFDNEMTQFFQAITPEKEDAFIELINSAGI